MIISTKTTSTPATESTNSPRRGDILATGGRFVGRAATTWVSYGDDADFRQMCADFDRIWNSPKRSRKSSAA